MFACLMMLKLATFHPLLQGVLRPAGRSRSAGAEQAPRNPGFATSPTP